MWHSLLLLAYKPVQHVTVLNTVGNCNTMVSIILWDHRRICSPSLTETSLCGAYLYKLHRQTPQGFRNPVHENVNWRRRSLPTGCKLLANTQYYQGCVELKFKSSLFWDVTPCKWLLIGDVSGQLTGTTFMGQVVDPSSRGRQAVPKRR
jgi:hypothetical protein